jgi:hypothetical protein
MVEFPLLKFQPAFPRKDMVHRRAAADEADLCPSPSRMPRAAPGTIPQKPTSIIFDPTGSKLCKKKARGLGRGSAFVSGEKPGNLGCKFIALSHAGKSNRVAVRAMTSRANPGGALQMGRHWRSFQSKERIWSQRTTPPTGKPSGTASSKG